MKTRGTTLVELMTVVAIIGVMASMSLYGLNQLTLRSRQVGAVREVLTLVLEARTEARARNQPVRFEVVETTGAAPAHEVRWTRLPCTDAWGRNCPDAACASATCSSGCPCERRSEPALVPGVVTITGLDGLCFIGGSAAPRGARCDPSTTAVTSVRFDLPDVTAPYLLVLEPLTGMARLIDCGRLPKDVACP